MKGNRLQTKTLTNPDKAEFILYAAFTALNVFSLIRSLILHNTLYILSSFAGMFLIYMPRLAERVMKITISLDLKCAYMALSVGGPVLGNVFKFYHIVPFWDKYMHGLSGYAFAALGYCLPDLIEKKEGGHSWQMKVAFAFCFSLTIGVFWEFVEFSVDRLFHMAMQKDTIVHTISSVMLDPTNKNIPITIDKITSVAVNGQDLGFDGYLDIGLYDTMEDLFVNFIGALTFSVFGYFYIKHRGKGRIAKAFIPTITETKKESDHEQPSETDMEDRDG